MFMFSRKFVYLIVVIGVVFGGGSPVNGFQCWKCNKGNEKNDVCDADHNGEAIECNYQAKNVCVLRQDRDKKDVFEKYCLGLSENFGEFRGCRQEGANRLQWICYCDTDLCNKDKNYGMDQISGGSGRIDGTSGSLYGISILCWLAMIMIYRN